LRWSKWRRDAPASGWQDAAVLALTKADGYTEALAIATAHGYTEALTIAATHGYTETLTIAGAHKYTETHGYTPALLTAEI
jgi:hypothetical protein